MHHCHSILLFLRVRMQVSTRAGFADLRAEIGSWPGLCKRLETQKELQKEEQLKPSTGEVGNPDLDTVGPSVQTRGPAIPTRVAGKINE